MHNQNINIQEKSKKIIYKFIEENENENNKNTKENSDGYNIIKEELRKDRIIFPLNKYKYIILTFLILVIFTFLKGSDHSKSIIGVKP